MELFNCVLELIGLRREWGTESRALAGLFSRLTPRVGPLRSVVLIGIKGKFALWMYPPLLKDHPLGLLDPCTGVVLPEL
jgi:hypothetical protein